mmetsp:Transcript_102855/g.268514  ORF Transcript_102855/g.268514 Transcript_102855/m.268514 type:complete len:289 (+) Transcript_102855:425-1291(+)
MAWKRQTERYHSSVRPTKAKSLSRRPTASATSVSRASVWFSHTFLPPRVSILTAHPDTARAYSRTDAAGFRFCGQSCWLSLKEEITRCSGWRSMIVPCPSRSSSDMKESPSWLPIERPWKAPGHALLISLKYPGEASMCLKSSVDRSSLRRPSELPTKPGHRVGLFKSTEAKVEPAFATCTQYTGFRLSARLTAPAPPPTEGRPAPEGALAARAARDRPTCSRSARASSASSQASSAARPSARAARHRHPSARGSSKEALIAAARPRERLSAPRVQGLAGQTLEPEVA